MKKITDKQRLDWLMSKLSVSWVTAWQPRNRYAIDNLMRIDAAILAEAKRKP